ncbi:glycosyltransferase family 4 protein [Bacillus anthracis]|uniref:glycosyltransferase family 4 protein n=1 Tax=Bacillus anthracis TaxID=1392 RepID=UPI002DBF7426|nr:glycosyltransferase family 4 protein [Bacillus anthracis]MEC0016668.1 glycosyltransferase family 4 protein [Bacillus anthracis]
MKVWMFPKTSETNQYNYLLSNSLEKKGVDVRNFRQRYIFKIKRGDVVHMHWIHSLYQSHNRLLFLIKSILLLLVIEVMKFRGIKFIWTIHNLYPHHYEYKSYEKWVRKRVINKCDKLITCANSIKDLVIQEFNINPEKISVIPHGDYVGVYKSKGLNFKEVYNIPENNFVYLFLGAIKRYKGVGELIEGFQQMNDSKSTLIIAGKADEETKTFLEGINNQNIIKDIRFIPDNEVADLIKVADVFVLPYKNITTSGSAILALSFKKPVVSPVNPFMKEYFDENTAVLYEKDSGLLKSLYDVKQKTFSDEDFNEKLEKINWGIIGEETMLCYLRAVK